MLDPRKTSQALITLAQELNATDPSTAAALQDLAGAVEGNAAMAEWAYADLNHVFDAEHIAQELTPPTWRSALSGLDLIRNVLVLVPLAITWIGIALAVNAYSALLTAEPEQASQSFIYLWQSGFGGRTWFTLERVAIADGTLLFLFFLVTVIYHIASGMLRQRHERRLTACRHSVQQIIAGADLALAAYRQPQPQAFYQQNQALSEHLLAALQQQAGRLDQLAATRQQEIGQLTDFTGQLERAALEIGTSAQNLSQMHHNAINTLAPIAIAVEALNNQTQAIESPLRDASQHLFSLASGQQQSVMLIAGVATQQQNLADQIVSGMSTLAEASNAVARNSLQLSEVSDLLLTEQSKLLGALAEERESQVNLANMVSQANAGVSEATRGIRDSAVNLRGVAVDLTPVAQGMPTLLHQVQSGLNLIRIEQEEAAARIANATSRVEGSAAALEQALDDLARTVQLLSLRVSQVANLNHDHTGNSGRMP